MWDRAREPVREIFQSGLCELASDTWWAPSDVVCVRGDVVSEAIGCQPHREATYIAAKASDKRAGCDR